MASTYGYVNLISSFGFTALWRHRCVEGLPLSDAECVVDLMSGMGELWRPLSASLRASARVVGIDLSPEMARRTPREWRFTSEIHVSDVLQWEGPFDSADVVVSSFGLKTFDREQQRQLAQRVARILKPGGSFSFIEISVPTFTPLRLLYMFYLSQIIPVIGQFLLGNPDCYRMLGAFTKAFGNAWHFERCLREAGLEARPVSYFFGCASGVRGFKPPLP